VLHDSVFARLKKEAARTGRTMSELVEDGLQLLFQPQKPPGDLRPLPTFDMGPPLVDISDRDALYRAMEEEG